MYQKEANYMSDSVLTLLSLYGFPIGTDALSKKAILVSHKSRHTIIRINEWLTVRRVVCTALIWLATIDMNQKKMRGMVSYGKTSCMTIM